MVIKLYLDSMSNIGAAVFALLGYDNNIGPMLIILDVRILYLKHITHTDDFSLNGHPASL